MKASDVLIEKIKQFEGFRAQGMHDEGDGHQPRNDTYCPDEGNGVCVVLRLVSGGVANQVGNAQRLPQGLQSRLFRKGGIHLRA